MARGSQGVRPTGAYIDHKAKIDVFNLFVGVIRYLFCFQLSDADAGMEILIISDSW